MKMKTIKVSTAKLNGKPPPGGKYPGIEPDIHFYEIEDGDNTEDEEESEILVIHELSLATSKQNIIKIKFPYIYVFGHQGLAVVRAMQYLIVRLF